MGVTFTDNHNDQIDVMKIQKMKRRNIARNVILLTLVASVVFSCTKDDSEECPAPVIPPDTNAVDSSYILMNFDATAAGEVLEWRKQYLDELGRINENEQAVYYVSNVYLISDDDQKTMIEDVQFIEHVDRGDLDPSEDRTMFYVTVASGSYKAIELTVGLNPEQNASDPNSFPTDHPLSSSKGTYWDMSTAYRFVMIEGRIDTTGDGDPDEVYGFHTGYDQSARTKTFTKTLDLSLNDTARVDFTWEVNEVFFGDETLDVAVEKTWHGEMSTYDRAERISNNFIKSLRLK